MRVRIIGSLASEKDQTRFCSTLRNYESFVTNFWFSFAFTRPLQCLIILLVSIILLCPSYIHADKVKEKEIQSGTPVLWQEPEDIGSRDLFYGQGGKESMPGGIFKYIKKSSGGTQFKIVVEDENGVRWKAKIGEEAQTETVAVRLLWAIGYFSDITYFVPELRIEGGEKMRRDLDNIRSLPIIHSVRLELARKGNHKDWSWFDNPFIGTREINGLKVMMALINNWDLKKSNNSAIFDKKTDQHRYYIHDLGASFGKTGGYVTRSKGDLKDYLRAKFIKRVEADRVDFVMNTRPPWIMFVWPQYFQRGIQKPKVVENIPRSDAKWVGKLLAKLSDDQIRDAFRAAGYKPDEVFLYAKAVRARIDELLKL
jgi:hypothetical protein